uniref:General transcription factor IIH subunit 3 n=1 Tax=Anopheles farauti TaxID=69004 RepID=A0A182QJ23_9DIPT
MIDSARGTARVIDKKTIQERNNRETNERFAAIFNRCWSTDFQYDDDLHHHREPHSPAMAFFKSIWKNSSKHKKLCEELALANSIRDFSENHDELEDGSNEAISYSVKYLGNTPVPTPRSENATAEAVKTIITAAKGNKKLQRVSLSISPKGIEMIDTGTGETLLQVSIYQISYCSADANHDHVFAFVGCTLGSEAEVKEMCFRRTAKEINLEGPLVCHAFLCQKRKMAQTVTLTVARSFERAFQIWQSKQFHAERKRKDLEERMERELRGSQELVGGQTAASESEPQHTDGSAGECRSLLIDFNSDLTEICSDTHHHRELLQNTWVGRIIREKPHNLTQCLDSIVAFANAHLMQKAQNKLAVLACHHHATQFLYPTPGKPLDIRQVDGQYEVFTLVEKTIKQKLAHMINTAPPVTTPTESLLAGSMSMALCYIARINRNKAPGTKINSRVLVVTGSNECASQYMTYMNVFFTAQKQGVVIDVCALDKALSLLQQGCDITGGQYLRLEQLEGFLQYLLWVFLPDPQMRCKLVLPPPVKVDYRAACFCHRELIDIGYVCSVCLSIFCKFSPICTTCQYVISKHTKWLNITFLY